MSTKEEIIERVSELLQTRSFEGFSFQDVADAVGIRKASIYSHFKSKDKVVEIVLNRWRDDLAQHFDSLDGLSADQKLTSYFDWYRKLHHGAERMCPGGSFAAIWSGVSPTVQLAVGDLGSVQIQWLTKTISTGRKKGTIIDSGKSAKSDADYIFASLQGALLFTRLSNNTRQFDNVVERLVAQFVG